MSARHRPLSSPSLLVTSESPVLKITPPLPTTALHNTAKTYKTPTSTGILKQVMDKRFLVLGHKDAIFGEENLLPHPKRPADIRPGVLSRSCTVFVDRHPAVNFITRTLPGRTFPSKAVHLFCGCLYSTPGRLYISGIGLHG